MPVTDPAPNIWLHIGLPKGASTYLQKRVFALAQRPSFSLIDQSRAFPWIWNLNKGAEAEVLGTGNVPDISLSQSSFFAASQGGHPPHSILSNEGLVGASFNPLTNTFRNAVTLRDAFGSAKVLLVFRRQDQWLGSIFRQLVIHENRFGGGMSLQDFQSLAGIGSDLEQLDWFQILQHWRSVFGLHNVTGIPVELLVQDPDEFIRQICLWAETDLQHPVSKDIVDPNSLLLDLSPRYIAKRLLARARPWKSGAAEKEVYSGSWPSPGLVDSNRLLAEVTGFDLERYRYF